MSTPYRDTSPGANVDAVATVRGRIGQHISVRSTAFSYNAAPTAGRLRILGLTSGWNVDVDVIAGGPDLIDFGESGVTFQMGEDVEGRIFAAGAAVTGKVTLNVDFVT